MPELCNCEYCLDIWLLRDKGGVTWYMALQQGNTHRGFGEV